MLAWNLPRAERLTLIDRTAVEVSLVAQANLLSLSRASLYYQPVGPSPREVAAKHRIDEIYTAHPYYGSRRITAVLQTEMTISRPTVQRYLREMGLVALAPSRRPVGRRPSIRFIPFGCVFCKYDASITSGPYRLVASSVAG